MARKNKAELAAEAAVSLAAWQAAEALTYPELLMAALEEATGKGNYELVVRDGVFSLRDRDGSRHDNPVNLSYAYSPEAQSLLEDLKYDLAAKAEARADAERRLAVKQAALNKLTKEERELLGLK